MFGGPHTIQVVETEFWTDMEFWWMENIFDVIQKIWYSIDRTHECEVAKQINISCWTVLQIQPTRVQTTYLHIYTTRSELQSMIKWLEHILSVVSLSLNLLKHSPNNTVHTNMYSAIEYSCRWRCHRIFPLYYALMSLWVYLFWWVSEYCAYHITIFARKYKRVCFFGEICLKSNYVKKNPNDLYRQFGQSDVRRSFSSLSHTLFSMLSDGHW